MPVVEQLTMDRGRYVPAERESSERIPPGKASTGDDLFERINRAASEIRTQVLDLNEKVDDLYFLLGEARREGTQLPHPRPRLPEPLRPPEPSSPEADPAKEVSRRLGAIGVTVVRIERNADHSAEITFEAVTLEKTLDVHLSADLADLLELLNDDCGHRTDDKVGWKTIVHLLKQMRRKTGKPKMRRGTITNDILKLRKTLEARNEIAWYWVQTNRRSGAYRVARNLGKQPPMIGGDLT